MKIAVTGAAGQLGTLVLRRLIDDRKVKAIVAIDLRPPLLVAGKLRAVRADVRDADIGRHLAGVDALFHFAFLVTQYAPRDEFDGVNVRGSQNVFRAAAAAGVKTIVYSSSVAAYGVVAGHPRPITEDAPRVRQERFPYARAKYDVEAFLDEFEPAHPDIAVTRLRPAILVGARMDHPFGASLRRRTLFASPHPLPLVWDEDVADAAIAAMQQRARGAFNLAAGEPVSSRELARAAGLRLVDAPRWAGAALSRASLLFHRAGLVRTVMDPAWLEEGEGDLVMSTARAQRELNWKPRCPTTIDVMRRFVAVVPRRPDPRIAVFLRMVDLAGRYGPPLPELRGSSARILLSLTGPGGGEWGILVGDSRVRVTSSPPRPPDAVITLAAELFLDLLAGKTDVARANFTGRIRYEGQGHAGMILGGMIATFRARTRAEGIGGHFTRALAGWFARGSTANSDNSRNVDNSSTRGAS